MKRLDEINRETKDEREKYGSSVCRNAFGMRQAVGFAGEQKFMKSAKTARSYFLYIFFKFFRVNIKKTLISDVEDDYVFRHMITCAAYTHIYYFFWLISTENYELQKA